jgi:hypothetical protein
MKVMKVFREYGAGGGEVAGKLRTTGDRVSEHCHC